jgi:hypothetical protein
MRSVDEKSQRKWDAKRAQLERDRSMEVEATMREASRLARLVLETNWTAVLEAADALIEHESLSGLALEAVLATTKPVQVGPARNRGDEDQGSDRPYSGAHPSD